MRIGRSSVKPFKSRYRQNGSGEVLRSGILIIYVFDKNNDTLVFHYHIWKQSVSF